MRTVTAIIITAILVNGMLYLGFNALEKEDVIKEKRDAEVYGLTKAKKAENIKRIEGKLK